jgi:hypothetical protein
MQRSHYKGHDKQSISRFLRDQVVIIFVGIINLARHLSAGHNKQDTLLYRAILGLALEVLSADGPRLPIDDLRERSMAHLLSWA